MHLLNLRLARSIYFQIVLIIIIIIKVNEFVVPRFCRPGDRLGRVMVDYVRVYFSIVGLANFD
jgi:hypothetical protein